MTDRVYPASKPNGTATATPAAAAAATNGGAAHPPAFPAPKSQLYNPTRHPYRPQPNLTSRRRRRSRRGCFCLCCFWSVMALTTLLLLAAIAGTVVYVLYRPHRPAFTVSAVKISRFNLTTAASDDTTHLTTSLNVTIIANNPNKKLIFYFDPITIAAASNQVQIANGSFPSFTSDPKNLTTIRTQLSTLSQLLDAESANSLRSDLRRKRAGMALKIQLDTRVIVKMEGLESNKVGIRVTCEGIHCHPPKGNSTSAALISRAKCKVDLRIKIWKFTF